MFNRRKFLTGLGAGAGLAALPFPSLAKWTDEDNTADTIIDAVEVIRITGPYTSISGVNRQYQVQQIHIYPEWRPGLYSDRTDSRETTSNISQYYLQIRTRGGLTGFYGAIDGECVTPVLQQLKPFLLGKNALAIESLWDGMYRNNRHGRAGHYMMALSAVDNVLWDIRGKYYNTPVYALLGGPTRKEVLVYGSCLSFTVESGKAGPKARQLFNEGFKYQKWFMAYGPGSGPQGFNHSVGLMEELRGSLGPDALIMVDAYMGWDYPFANAWCREVEKYRPYFLEEAFPSDRLESFVQLSQHSSIPLATGEHFYSRWEALHFLKAGAIQVVQSDPEWCGGVSELVKTCHIASAFGAKVIPHGHNIHAALHVVASQSPGVCPFGEYLINHMPYKLNFQKNPLLTANGILPLPTLPGFGIELDESKVEKKEVV